MENPKLPPYSAVLIVLEDGLVPWQSLAHWQWAWRPRGPALSERNASSAIKRSVLAWDRRRWHGLTGSAAPLDDAAYRQHLRETLAELAGHALPEAETEAVIARFLKPTSEVERFSDSDAALGALLRRELKVGVVSSLPSESFRWMAKRAQVPESMLIELPPGTAPFPDPAAFRAAAEKLGVPRRRTLLAGALFWSEVRAAGRAGLNGALLDRHDWWARVEADRWNSLRALVDAPQSAVEPPAPSTEDTAPAP